MHRSFVVLHRSFAAKGEGSSGSFKDWTSEVPLSLSSAGAEALKPREEAL